jgi:CTP-dependent riboflavin kinase
VIYLSGTVAPGRGFGAERMADPGLLNRLQQIVGFPVVPGTLNVRLSEPLERDSRWRYHGAAEISPDWEERTGQAGYFLVPARVAERYRCVCFQADEPGYPADLIELICEVHIRSTLGLSHGDHILLSVLEP